MYPVHNDNGNQLHIVDEADNKRKKKKCKIQDIVRYSKQFCEFTSIQGPAYIVKNESLWERLWWIFIFIVGMVGSCIMVYKIYDKYVTTPVLVSLATKEARIRDIPFPAVTICPQAKVSRKCLNYTEILLARKKGEILDTDREENEHFDFLSLLCKAENHNGTFSLLLESFNISSADMGNETFEEDHLEDYGEFLSNCTTVDLEKASCQWMGVNVECKDVLTPVLTEKGLCYSFNMYDVRDIYSDLNTMKYFPAGNRRRDWFPDRGYVRTADNVDVLYPRRALLSGARNAFVIVIFTHKDDITYACEDFATQGMLVTLHTPVRIARPERVSFSVGLDSMTIAAVKPSFTETSDKIKHYDPWKRFCYFDNERHLKYFKFYSQSSCNFECLVNYTIKYCGCVNFYMPRDNNTGVCTLENRFCLQESRTNYTEEVLREKLKFNNESYGETACNCLPLCADLNYNTELSQSSWDWSNSDEVELDSIRSEMENYRASAVKIFFKTGFFLPSQRDELYGTNDLISNIGGVVNLFVGVSLITCGEIIYFLSIKLIDNYYRYGYCIGP